MTDYTPDNPPPQSVVDTVDTWVLTEISTVFDLILEAELHCGSTVHRILFTRFTKRGEMPWLLAWMKAPSSVGMITRQGHLIRAGVVHRAIHD